MAMKMTRYKERAERLKQLPEAPVYRPTAIEFHDPLEYIRKIRGEAEQYGICRIVPPASWKPPFVLNTDTFKFPTRVQRVHELQERGRLDFIDGLLRFLEKRGTVLKHAPEYMGRPVDLWRLFREVTRRGGYTEVCAQTKWSSVADALHVPEYHATRGLDMKSLYEQYLQAFEMIENAKKKKDENIKPPTSPTAVTEVTGQPNSTTADESTRTRVDTEPGSSSAGKPTRSSSSRDRFTADPISETESELGQQEEPETETETDDDRQSNRKRSTSRSKPRSPSGSSDSGSHSERWNEIVCEVCKSGKRENKILLCDTCNRGYHIYCLKPPLERIPKGDWFCESCHKHTEMKLNPLVLSDHDDSIADSENVPYGFDDGEEFSWNDFEKKANQFKYRWFNRNSYTGSHASLDSISELEVESEFWRIVEDAEKDVSVLYGSDLDTGVLGSGFPNRYTSRQRRGAKGKYAMNPWNLNNLPHLPRCLLRDLDRNISGIIVPWMYIGMCFSSFSWHVEDHNAYSINYLHGGAPKTWYGIASADADKFETVMRTTLPELFEQQPDLLFHLVTMLSPLVLADKGVKVARTVQHRGEFVITFPKAYHAGFNHGFNCAEACNFALADWLPFGYEDMERRRQYRKGCVFSHEQLMCTLARKPNLDVETAKFLLPDLNHMRDEELKQRSIHEGMEGVELLPMEHIEPFDMKPVTGNGSLVPEKVSSTVARKRKSDTVRTSVRQRKNTKANKLPSVDVSVTLTRPAESTPTIDSSTDSGHLNKKRRVRRDPLESSLVGVELVPTQDGKATTRRSSRPRKMKKYSDDDESEDELKVEQGGESSHKAKKHKASSTVATSSAGRGTIPTEGSNNVHRKDSNRTADVKKSLESKVSGEVGDTSTLSKAVTSAATPTTPTSARPYAGIDRVRRERAMEGVKAATAMLTKASRNTHTPPSAAAAVAKSEPISEPVQPPTQQEVIPAPTIQVQVKPKQEKRSKGMAESNSESNQMDLSKKRRGRPRKNDTVTATVSSTTVFNSNNNLKGKQKQEPSFVLPAEVETDRLTVGAAETVEDFDALHKSRSSSPDSPEQSEHRDTVDDETLITLETDLPTCSVCHTFCFLSYAEAPIELAIVSESTSKQFTEQGQQGAEGEDGPVQESSQAVSDGVVPSEDRSRYSRASTVVDERVTCLRHIHKLIQLRNDSRLNAGDKIMTLPPIQIRYRFTESELNQMVNQVQQVAEMPRVWRAKLQEAYQVRPTLAELQSLYAEGKKIPADPQDLDPLKMLVRKAVAWTTRVRSIVASYTSLHTGSHVGTRFNLSVHMAPAEEVRSLLEQTTELNCSLPDLELLQELDSKISQWREEAQSVRVALDSSNQESQIIHERIQHLVNEAAKLPVDFKHDLMYLKTRLEQEEWKRSMDNILTGRTTDVKSKVDLNRLQNLVIAADKIFEKDKRDIKQYRQAVDCLKEADNWYCKLHDLTANGKNKLTIEQVQLLIRQAESLKVQIPEFFYWASIQQEVESWMNLVQSVQSRQKRYTPVELNQLLGQVESLPVDMRREVRIVEQQFRTVIQWLDRVRKLFFTKATVSVPLEYTLRNYEPGKCVYRPVISTLEYCIEEVGSRLRSLLDSGTKRSHGVTDSDYVFSSLTNRPSKDEEVRVCWCRKLKSEIEKTVTCVSCKIPFHPSCVQWKDHSDNNALNGPSSEKTSAQVTCRVSSSSVKAFTCPFCLQEKNPGSPSTRVEVESFFRSLKTKAVDRDVKRKPLLKTVTESIQAADKLPMQFEEIQILSQAVELAMNWQTRCQQALGSGQTGTLSSGYFDRLLSDALELDVETDFETQTHAKLWASKVAHLLVTPSDETESVPKLTLNQVEELLHELKNQLPAIRHEWTTEVPSCLQAVQEVVQVWDLYQAGTSWANRAESAINSRASLGTFLELQHEAEILSVDLSNHPLVHTVNQHISSVQSWIEGVDKMIGAAQIGSYHARPTYSDAAALLERGQLIPVSTNQEMVLMEMVQKAESWVDSLRDLIIAFPIRNMHVAAVSHSHSLKGGGAVVDSLIAVSTPLTKADRRDKRKLSGSNIGSADKKRKTALSQPVPDESMVVQQQSKEEKKYGGINSDLLQIKTLFAEASQQFFCVCELHQIGEGEVMVGCDYCDNWFHSRCVGLNQLETEQIQEYMCPACCQTNGVMYKFDLPPDPRSALTRGVKKGILILKKPSLHDLIQLLNIYDESICVRLNDELILREVVARVKSVQQRINTVVQLHKDDPALISECLREVHTLPVAVPERALLESIQNAVRDGRYVPVMQSSTLNDEVQLSMDPMEALRPLTPLDSMETMEEQSEMMISGLEADQTDDLDTDISMFMAD